MILCSTTARASKPIDEALADIRAAGFQGVDLQVIDGWCHVNPSELVADYDRAAGYAIGLLKKHGLACPAINLCVTPHLYMRDAASVRRLRDETEAACRFMKDVGASVAGIQPRETDPSRPEAEVVADCYASLRDMAEIAAQSGVKFGLELHAGSTFETERASRDFLRDFPGLYVVYDPSHFLIRGMAMRDSRWLLERACHVHLRDAALGELQTRTGEGAADFAWFVKAAREVGYAGPIAVENLEGRGFDALEDAAKLAKMVEGLL